MTDLRLLLVGLVELEREAGERAAERQDEARARLRRATWDLERVRLSVEALARDERPE